MAHQYDLPKKYIVKIVFRCCVALQALAHSTPYAQGGLRKPTSGELLEIKQRNAGIASHGLEEYALVVDGLILRAPAPPKHLQDGLRSLFWNGHYRHWGYTILVMCDLRGIGVWNSQPLMLDEQTAAIDQGVTAMLRDVRDDLDENVGILSDSLYAFNLIGDLQEKRVPHMFSVGPGTLDKLKILAFDTSARVPPAVRADAVQALYTSRAVAQLRAVVENRNRLFRTYGPLNQGAVFRGRVFARRGVGKYMPTPLMVVDCVSFLLNRRMLLGRPLRAANWRPKPLTLVDTPAPADFRCHYPKFGSKYEIVNRNQLQYYVPKVFYSYFPKKTRKKKASVVDDNGDESAETESDNDKDVHYKEVDDEMVYDVTHANDPKWLTTRQQAALENRGKKPERFRVDDDALATAERGKRKK